MWVEESASTGEADLEVERSAMREMQALLGDLVADEAPGLMHGRPAGLLGCSSSGRAASPSSVEPFARQEAQHLEREGPARGRQTIPHPQEFRLLRRLARVPSDVGGGPAAPWRGRLVEQRPG